MQKREPLIFSVRITRQVTSLPHRSVNNDMFFTNGFSNIVLTKQVTIINHK